MSEQGGGDAVLTRQHILDVMRRLGLGAGVEAAREQLPELIDPKRDAALLAGLGLGDLNAITGQLGGSP